jgi:DNA-directed RNA polymerase I subunit RPA2
MPSTFETLERERFFRHPPQNGASVPILNEFVIPHLESFNALFDDSGLPLGDGDGKGLLSLALKDIGERVVFSGTDMSDEGSGEKGTRMRSKFIAYTQPLSLSNRICPSLDRAGHNSSANGLGQR